MNLSVAAGTAVSLALPLAMHLLESCFKRSQLLKLTCVVQTAQQFPVEHCYGVTTDCITSMLAGSWVVNDMDSWF